MVQKYFKGDLVQIGPMPFSMKHFRGNCKAIVLYTYKEAHGGQARHEQDYALYVLPRGGTSAWYLEEQLTLIEPNRFDLLPKGHTDRLVWEAKQQRDNKGD